MKITSVAALVLPALLLSAYSGLMSGAQERKRDIDNILTSFPGYHLLTLKERDSDTRAYILQYLPRANPSVVLADFDGDGHLHYAMLLKNDKSATTKLVVLLCPESDPCRSVYDLDVATDSGSIFIRPVSAGSKVPQTDALDSKDRNSPVKLQLAGIRVTYFGQAEVVLYWDRKLKKIQEFQTKD